MDRGNRSTVTEFILLGLTNDPNIQILLSFFLIVIYTSAFTANSLLILAVSFDHRLHNPMYFFIINLSFLNLFSPSITIPKMLEHSLSGKKSISLAGCTSQIFFYLLLGQSECNLLVLMAYDRFVAICKPLRYNMIMDRSTCAWMITVIWTVSSVILTFCNPNIINHFICEIPSLLPLSCSDTSVLDSMRFGGGIVFLLFPLALILFSYFRIIISITRIHSGRYKAFSTCSSHLIVVTLFYGTAMVLYLRPRLPVSDNTDKLTSVFYVIFTPVLNPLIYSLRNKDVLRAMRRLVSLL
ncbi:olfactory receptor 10A7-like [Pelobates fuscus]|uniref:olfactory receptor 10A7-like n=1 Tax=Pelobates fuscus TaxID=191477 RepID=UPI002FE43ECE